MACTSLSACQSLRQDVTRCDKKIAKILMSSHRNRDLDTVVTWAPPNRSFLIFSTKVSPQLVKQLVLVLYYPGGLYFTARGAASHPSFSVPGRPLAQPSFHLISLSFTSLFFFVRVEHLATAGATTLDLVPGASQVQLRVGRLPLNF
jgi:hypothetical protein